MTQAGMSAADASAAIVLEELTRDFDGTRAVDGLTLRIPRGEVFGFLGPNGAGKTTTLKMLAGLLSPTSGRAYVAGEPVSPGAVSLAVARKVGFLAEEPRFYQWMRGREFLVFVGQVYGLDEKASERRADELLELVGLADRGGDKVRGYSRGMRQRLGIAHALMGDPEVLLLDEPASALDPIGRKEILELIGSLRGRATIVMSSHVLDDVQRVATWVGVIRQGRLLAESPLHELLKLYARPAYKLELGGPEERTAVQEALASEPWLVEVVEQGTSLRLLVDDQAAAQERVPTVLSSLSAHLVGFETETPSLEDVFIRLITDGPAEDPRAETTTDEDTLHGNEAGGGEAGGGEAGGGEVGGDGPDGERGAP
jgi:ABC-2 type transport system ATP-binding protein